MSLEHELIRLAVWQGVVVTHDRFKFGIRQYPRLPVRRCGKDLIARPVKGDLVRVDILLMR